MSYKMKLLMFDSIVSKARSIERKRYTDTQIVLRHVNAILGFKHSITEIVIKH